MAVAVDATGTGQTGVAATSLSQTVGITVGSGANRILVTGIQFGANPGTITTFDWDSAGTPQAMTQVGAIQAESDNLGFATIFARIAPTAGLKNVHIAWTNSVDWTLGAISFTGADQGSVATTCKNFISGNPAASTAGAGYPFGGATVNSPVGDFAVLFAASNLRAFQTSANGLVGTNLYALNTNVSGAGVYTAGTGAATALACGCQGGVSLDPACYVGCDIAAVVAASTPTPVLGPGGISIFRVRQFSSQGRRQIYG